MPMVEASVLPLSAPAPDIAAAYREVLAFTRSHYENFPVASALLPRALKRHVAAVYAFARHADDFADEPGFDGRRLALLDDWETQLVDAARGQPPRHVVFQALGATLRELDLPLTPFTDLLVAFRRDVSVRRHADFAALADYCRFSANPVGRLVLLLHGDRDPETHRRSDDVCTALQLANFWQDVAVDLERDRIYLPQDDMARFGVSESDLRTYPAGQRFRDLLAFEVERTRELFRSGWPVTRRVRGRLAVELRLTVWGGWRILDRIERLDFDTVSRRPVVTRGDWALLLWRGLLGLAPPGARR